MLRVLSFSLSVLIPLTAYKLETPDLRVTGDVERVCVCAYNPINQISCLPLKNVRSPVIQ